MARHNFRNLKTWLHGMDLVDDVYLFAKTLPDDEKYGLRSQIKRCAVSIPSNVAEGSAKNSDKDFVRFLGIALGSSYELETQLIICERQRIGDQNALPKLVTGVQEIQRMITSFQNYLRKS